MNAQLLVQIVTQSVTNVTANNPYGYCFIPVASGAELDALVAGGMIKKGGTSNDGQYWAVAPTEAGAKTVAEWNAQPSHTPAQQTGAVQQGQVQQQPAQHQPVQHRLPDPSTIKIEDNVPLPPARSFGRQQTGESLIDKYPFKTLNVSQSFYLPPIPGAEKPLHRTFSNVVSAANKQLHPKNFVIREENGGARVFRLDDLTGPRPTRSRRADNQVAQQQTPMPQGGGGFMPQAGGMPSGFGPGPVPGNPAGTAPIPGVDFMPDPNNPGMAFGQAGGGAFIPPAGQFQPAQPQQPMQQPTATFQAPSAWDTAPSFEGGPGQV